MVRRAVVTAGAVTGVVAAALVGGGRRYRRDLALAHNRLERLDRQLIATEWGTIEYAETGAGQALLVSHGIFHGCDGGLLSARDVVEEHRIIAPSRFGYLGSDLPPVATSASQADAFAALLDDLDVESVDVLAVSAGTTAAVQLALRHRERVDHLVLSSGSFLGSPTAQAPPGWAKVFYSDRVMWTLKTFGRPMFSRLMGIPEGFPRDDADERAVTEMLDSIFPVDLRAEGAVFDAYVSNPEIVTCPLEALTVPTLLVHARDDPLASYEAAVQAADRIPHATLVGLDSGGHLQLGQAARVRAEVASFLAS